jgi:hypothetical protein
LIEEKSRGELKSRDNPNPRIPERIRSKQVRELAESTGGIMSERVIRETNEAIYIRGYGVGGQRFRLSNGKTGWYVVTFSGSDSCIDYWVMDDRFYRAFMRFVEPRTFDVEMLSEPIDIGPERKMILLEAIRRWETKNEENHSGCCQKPIH